MNEVSLILTETDTGGMDVETAALRSGTAAMVNVVSGMQLATIGVSVTSTTAALELIT